MKILVYSLVICASVFGNIWIIKKHQSFKPKQVSIEKSETNEPKNKTLDVAETIKFPETKIEALKNNNFFNIERVVVAPRIHVNKGGSNNAYSMTLIGIYSVNNVKKAIISLPVEKKSRMTALQAEVEYNNAFAALSREEQNEFSARMKQNPEKLESIKQQVIEKAQKTRQQQVVSHPQSNNNNNNTELKSRHVKVGEILDNEFEVTEIYDRYIVVSKGSTVLTLELDSSSIVSVVRKNTALNYRNKTQGNVQGAGATQQQNNRQPPPQQQNNRHQQNIKRHQQNIIQQSGGGRGYRIHRDTRYNSHG